MTSESDKLLDHDYDGITEYDNPLPRWWVWLFYGTIIFAVLYFPYYGLGWGPSTGELYEAEVAEAKKMAPAAQPTVPGPGPAVGGAANARPVVSMEGDAAAIAAGKTIYATNCLPCHGDKGQGLIGPNLTDAYWLHGNTFKEVSQVVTEGVPEKGMIAWKVVLNPTKIGQVSAFVLSLKGSNPANPKPPQGKKFPE